MGYIKKGTLMVLKGQVFCVLFLSLFLISVTGYSQNINLRDTTNQYDYIIITVPQFVNTCQSYKEHKQIYNNFNVLIVDTAMIYSQFPDSSRREDRIRNFISYAGKYWEAPNPKYFLLAGDIQCIPAFYYDEFPNVDTGLTDFFYLESIYHEPINFRDFCVGRIPAANNEELNNYFVKAVNYDYSPPEPWNNNALFFAQIDSLYDYPEVSQFLADQFPSYVHSRVLIADEDTTLHVKKDSLLLEITLGTGSLWFLGHGDDSVFINENYFNISDIIQMDNDKNFFFFPVICQGYGGNLFDKSVLSTHGALGGIGFSLHTWYMSAIYYFKLFAKNMYLSNDMTLGELLSITNESTVNSHYIHTKMVMNIWGDPSLKLKHMITAADRDAIPLIFSLSQNYPNPFNPSCQISFTLKEGAFTSLKIYDLLGKEAAVLVNEFKSSGTHTIDFKADNMASGIYFYTITSGRNSQTKKMILLR